MHKKTLILLIMVLLLLTIPALSHGESEETTIGDIAVLGDSMTWIGGDSCENSRGWTHHFVESAKPSTMTIYARSGATWTNTIRTQGDTTEYSEVITDENVIYPQSLRLINDVTNGHKQAPAMVIIYAGANDAWFAARRPGIFDNHLKGGKKPSECRSLATSISLVCDTLSRALPHSRIVMVTPVEMSKVSAAEIRRVSDIIEREAANHGIVTLRADKDLPIKHDIEKRNDNGVKRYTTDGVHTNEAGARLIGNYLSEEIKHIYNQQH